MTEAERKEAITMFFALKGLTHREVEVASLVATGMRAKDIGTNLCVGVQTVKFHLTNIYEKLKINNKRDLALMVSKLVEQ